MNVPLPSTPDWLPYAPTAGVIVAVVGTIISALTLLRAGRNLRQQLRPVIAVELRPWEGHKGVILVVVTNYGQQLARDVDVTFTPTIKDPDHGAEQMTSSTTMLVRQFARQITMLAPHAEILQIYYDFGQVVGEGRSWETRRRLSVRWQR